MKIKAFVLTIIISLGIVSCTSQKSKWQGTIENVDGVTIVKNPKEPIYKENVCGLEEELVIGNDVQVEEYRRGQF
jgi:hypothetical protein